MQDNIHYQAICHFYGARRAECSRAPLINHINEGLFILEQIDASR